MKFWKLAASALGAASVASGTVTAQETTTYKYDALGRLIKVEVAGGPATGTNVTYTHDAAGNRTNVTVTDSPNGSSGGDNGAGASVGNRKFVVVPLNGYTLIFIN